MDTRFHYGERLPAPPLRRWIWSYWEFRVETGAPGPVSHHVPPDGCTCLVGIVAEGAATTVAVSGPWLEPLVVPADPAAWYCGLRFRPGAAGPALGVPAERLRNASQPLVFLSPGLAAVFGASLAKSSDLAQAAETMDGVMSRHLAGRPEPDQLVGDAVDRIMVASGDSRIGELAGTLGVSPRTLLRRFRAATGLTPKQFARICRFRDAAKGMVGADQPEWARRAVEGGYADQSHLIRESRGLMGLTPSDIEERIRRTRHDDLVS